MKFIFLSVCLLAMGNSLALDLDLSGKAYVPKNQAFSPIRAGMAIQPKTDTLKPTGNSVLRRLQAQGQYTFFTGRIQKTARDSMSFFQPTSMDAWDLMLHARFYKSSPTPDSKELPDIYWDGSILIVPGEIDSLFAQTEQGTSVFLSIPAQPVTINLSTSPRGATVKVSDNILGTTPIHFQWLSGRWVWVRLEKLGYFTWEDIIEADPEQPIDVNVNLMERPTFQDGTPVDTNGIVAHGSKDFNAVEALISRITATRISVETQDAIQGLSAYLDTLRTRQYVEYIPPQNLSVGDWDAQKGGMPVRLWYGSNDFDFGFIGLIPCGQEEAYALKALLKAKQRSTTLKNSSRVRRSSWPSAHATALLDGFVKLKYRNWVAETRSQSRNVRRYFALDGLELVLPDQTVALPGTFVPAAYITQSQEWKSFIEFTREQAKIVESVQQEEQASEGAEQENAPAPVEAVPQPEPAKAPETPAPAETAPVAPAAPEATVPEQP